LFRGTNLHNNACSTQSQDHRSSLLNNYRYSNPPHILANFFLFLNIKSRLKRKFFWKYTIYISDSRWKLAKDNSKSIIHGKKYYTRKKRFAEISKKQNCYFRVIFNHCITFYCVYWEERGLYKSLIWINWYLNSWIFRIFVSGFLKHAIETSN